MPEVSNEFISHQLDRVLDRLGAIEDQIAVLTDMATRNTSLVLEIHDTVDGTKNGAKRGPDGCF
jgi:hypothetical protein